MITIAKTQIIPHIIFCSHFLFSKKLCFARNCPTVCVTGAGVGWGGVGSGKNLKPEKCLETAQNPQRPVHALFGGSSATQLLSPNSVTFLRSTTVNPPLTMAMDGNIINSPMLTCTPAKIIFTAIADTASAKVTPLIRTIEESR